MEVVERTPPRLSSVALARVDLGELGAWLAPAALIVYLALQNGGFDIAPRTDAGIICWWVVLVGTLVGALPTAGGTRAGRVLFCILALFAGWTALSLTWTGSAERTTIEIGRAAAYLGFFALALALQGGNRWRHALNGVTAGVGAVVVLAALSRLEPNWFPAQTASDVLAGGPALVRRLAYPLNYSSGVAAVTALALPLLLAAIASSRRIALQALSAALIPVAALTLWFTGSGQAIPLGLIGLAAYFALAPDRLPKLASLAIGASGGAILVAAANDRAAVTSGLTNDTALRQGDELLTYLVVVCAGVALAQVGLSMALRHGQRPDWLRISRRTTVRATVAAALVTLVVAIAADVPASLSNSWEQFKAPDSLDIHTESQAAYLVDVSGSGRYEFWQAAADAYRSDTWTGIGAGTFEFWWAKDGTLPTFIRNAHSLFMETLAELGIVGFLLLIATFGGIVAVGLVRLVRASDELRGALAAALAGIVVFIAAAAIDWEWQLAALTAAFMFLAAFVVGGGAQPLANGVTSRGWKALVAALAVAALVAMVIPLATSSSVDRSEAAAAQGRLTDALRYAAQASSIAPYAATPKLQEALIYERQGNFPLAVNAARGATRAEPVNWRNWLVLSRLEAESGNPRRAVSAYREARSLNPRSALLP